MTLEYLEHAAFRLPPSLAGLPTTQPSPSARRFWHVRGFGRAEKFPQPHRSPTSRSQGEDLLAGLYGSKIPIAFAVHGGPSRISIHIGTWMSAQIINAAAAQLDEHHQIVRTVLSAAYDAVDVRSEPSISAPSLRGGLVLGIPAVKPLDSSDPIMPLDRLIRAMTGSNWEVLVLAEPVAEDVVFEMRRRVLAEMLLVHKEALETRLPSPLAEHHQQLLRSMLKAHTTGQAMGMWRIAVYLLGDDASYPRLSSVWRGLFAGAQSLPEPLCVWECQDAISLADKWAMLDVAGAPAKGQRPYSRLYEYQPLLNSAQLAAYIHLPSQETSGFKIAVASRFSQDVPEITDTNALPLGKVIEHNQITARWLTIRLRSLTRHTLITGLTGSGKTTNVQSVLHVLTTSGKPWMVIAPSKIEYRELLNDPVIGPNLHIFTAGDETTAPLRLNPFEVPHGFPINVHLDLLREVFVASFGLWQPLPAILEQSLHAVYQDRGWDITSDTNYRLPQMSSATLAFPILTDLIAKVEEIIKLRNHDPVVQANMQAALVTRLESLRVGGKGRMLDTQCSFPIKLLLEHPTILELEAMGSDDDKAFLMGLLLIRLVEARRLAGKSRDLGHVLVIEEAHRLLTNVGERAREEEANPRGKAVALFANLIVEMRAYGQGIVVVDQIPVKLAPEVIKATSLKIAHTTVEASDRAVLAGAMAMNETQATCLTTLPVGQAIVFAEGHDAPFLVQMAQRTSSVSQSWPDNARVADHMVKAPGLQPYRSLYLAYPTCANRCKTIATVCQPAKLAAEQRRIQRSLSRLLLSFVEDSDALDRLWPDLMTAARTRYPPDADTPAFLRCLLIHSAHRLAHRRGAQAGWSYAETVALAELIADLLLARLDRKADGPLRQQAQSLLQRLYARQRDPLPFCSRICKQSTPQCVYRHAVADLISEGRVGVGWQQADDQDRRNGERKETWGVCLDVAEQVVEYAEPGLTKIQRQAIDAAAYRAGLCFAQQMLLRDETLLLRTATVVMDKLMKEAGQ